MPIKARYVLSSQFLEGLKSLVESIKKGEDIEDFFTLQQKNLTAILFSVNFIEARINELVAVFEIDKRTVLHERIKAILDIERKISLIEKFNLICAQLNEKLWDSSTEPFQSFEVIQTLRNEIVHNKGKFDSRGKIPKKLKNLIHQLEIKIEEDDLWIQVILESKTLSQWILNSTKQIDNIIRDRILKKLT